MNKVNSTSTYILMAVLLLLGPASSSTEVAQARLDWQVIAGGGFTGTSASYTLTGTVAQPVVGLSSSANHSINSGFWQSFAADQCCVGMRGDVNRDESINGLDLLFLVKYLFKSGPEPVCLESGDVNTDGKIDGFDLLYLVSYLFKGGPEPPSCLP